MNGRMRSLVLTSALALSPALGRATPFDHQYGVYGDLLTRHVTAAGVDYAALKADRQRLDRTVDALDAPSTRDMREWTRAQQMAFWINAYNVFTLRAIAEHYPIQSGWLTAQPRNSIRQIDGVWTKLRWQAAGRSVTLDDIEHRILRPVFKDARIHFAVNCASVSCPPLATEPYRADRLDAQLDGAARRFLASAEGVRIDGHTLQVSSLFKWYGNDFVSGYAPLVPGARDRTERAIRGAIVKYGAPPAAALARDGRSQIAFLRYDWSLNDVRRAGAGRLLSDTPAPVAKINGMPYIAQVQVYPPSSPTMMKDPTPQAMPTTMLAHAPAVVARGQ